MRDPDCVAFLQWALPHLQMRWAGFRRVRRQVCKRLARRIDALGLDGVAAYRAYLAQHAQEWSVLDGLCQVTISRFYRDRQVFAFLGETVLPALAEQARVAGRRVLQAWSAGCGAGEEPYTLGLVWQWQVQKRFPELALHIVATDANVDQCRRARQACYPWGSIKNLPDAWREEVFAPDGDRYCLKPRWRGDVDFVVQDIRRSMPAGPFDLVLCRNLVFTYYTEALQCRLLAQLHERLRPGGALVLGIRERLPACDGPFEVWMPRLRIYRRAGSADTGCQSSPSDHAERKGR